MTPLRACLPVLPALFLLASVPARGDDAKRPPFTPGKQDIQFKEASPLTADKDLPGRFGAKDKVPEYDITKEKFEIIVPKEYSHDAAWGLMVWMPSGNKPGIPSDIEAVLAEHKLISICPHNGGPGRNMGNAFPYDRFRLAVDAAHNMKGAFNIDPKRVFVGGLGAAGSKVAGIAGIAYGDVFTGTYCPGGIQFHVKVPGDPGKYYPPVFTPNAKALAAARKDGRFVLIGNDKDQNGLAVQRTAEKGFKPAGLKVLYIDAADKAPGTAEFLAKAIEFLDARK